MAKRQRWMIEGEWSGYTQAQQHIVHRHYTTRQAEAVALAKMYGIRYTDGTQLVLHVSEVTGLRKRLPEINGYYDLIAKCLRAGVDSVDALYKKESQSDLQIDRETEASHAE